MNHNGHYWLVKTLGRECNLCAVILYYTRVAIIAMDYIPGCREQINFNSIAKLFEDAAMLLPAWLYCV